MDREEQANEAFCTFRVSPVCTIDIRILVQTERVFPRPSLEYQLSTLQCSLSALQKV